MGRPGPDRREGFTVTLYAGSRRRMLPTYAELARQLGRGIAERGWVLAYGGANIGLMGECADAALAAGGEVRGVILDTFSRVAHRGLHALEVVDNMRERKAGLAHLGDAFVALPGGFGTLEELSEILVERQLAHHHKPLVLVSPDGFWDALIAQFERMVESGLLKREYLGIISVVPDAAGAIAAIEKSAAPVASPATADKW